MMFMRLFPRFYLLLNGGIYGVLACLFIVSPREWFANLGISLEDVAGYTELQTMYVGLMGTLALFFLMAGLIRSWHWPGLMLALTSYLLLAMVRAYGLLIVGQGNDFMWQLLWTELISAVFAGIAMLCLRSPASRSLAD